MEVRVWVAWRGRRWQWPGIHGELESEATGRWDGGQKVGSPKGVLTVGGLGFFPEGVTGQGPAVWSLTRIPGRLSSGTAEGLKVQTERTRSMLLFANVSARHYGNYTCRAANRLGTSSASMRLLRASPRSGRGGAGAGAGPT